MFRNVPCSWFYRRPPASANVTQAPALLQNSPIASTVPMTDFPSPVFRWRYTPSLFTALPLAPVRFLNVNVLLLFYSVVVLFVLCLAICSLCSVLPSAPRKVLVLLLRLP